MTSATHQRAINTSMRRMLAQLVTSGSRLFVKYWRQIPAISGTTRPARKTRPTAISGPTAILLQSKVSINSWLTYFPFVRFATTCSEYPPSQVVTQPYDKITPAMQEHYYAASPYNLVRIILGRREQADNTVENVYTRAAGLWPRMAAQKAFCSRIPSLRFTPIRRPLRLLRGRSLNGAASSLWAGSRTIRRTVVYRHEQTLAKPKADRLDLLRATRTHYEQLFLLYEDSGEIDALLATPNEPAIDVTDEYGVAHRVWQILRSQRRECRSGEDARQETGYRRWTPPLRNRAELPQRMPREGRDQRIRTAPYEFVMMTFVNMNDPGLLVLPTHRVVHSLHSFSFDRVSRTRAANFCRGGS